MKCLPTSLIIILYDTSDHPFGIILFLPHVLIHQNLSVEYLEFLLRKVLGFCSLEYIFIVQIFEWCFTELCVMTTRLYDDMFSQHFEKIIPLSPSCHCWYGEVGCQSIGVLFVESYFYPGIFMNFFVFVIFQFLFCFHVSILTKV